MLAVAISMDIFLCKYICIRCQTFHTFLVASNSSMVLMSILTWKLCIQLYSCCTHRQVIINLTKVLKMQLYRNIDMHKAFKHSYVLNFCRQSLEKNMSIFESTDSEVYGWTYLMFVITFAHLCMECTISVLNILYWAVCAQ